MNVADALVERLLAWGVHRIFGYSGDGVDPVLGALRRAGNDPELVTARHEESAAFMATAHAKWTGDVGCCMATHGPGAIHLLNGLYDAKLDKKPVVALIGQQHRSVLGSGYQQEIDAAVLFKDVCSAFVQTVTMAEQLFLVVDRAFRNALATRGPTCVILPHDVQQLEFPASMPHEHARIATAAGWSSPRVLPSDDSLDRAASLLNEGDRIAVLVGQGARNARSEVLEVAERLGAGVAKALLGKPVVPDDLPFVTGAVGHLGTTASDHLMQECDTLLMIGTNEPYTEFLPAPGQARAVQIDIDGRNIGTRYPTEVELVGDSAETLRALLPRLDVRARDAWRDQVVTWVREWSDIAARRAARTAEPLNPQLVLRELSSRLEDDTLLAVDVGSVTYWYARHICMRGTMDAHLSSTLASMGSAMPYAVAAKLAFPGRLVVALAGDGAMQMNGINELITVARLWRDWEDPRLPILVLDNQDLNEVTWEQRESEGDPAFPESQSLASIPYAEYAELLGLAGRRVDSSEEIGAAWDAALSADRPFLLHAVVDAAVPLVPPRVEPSMRESMFRGLDQEDTPLGRRAFTLLRAELADQE